MNSNLHPHTDTSDTSIVEGQALANDRRPSFESSEGFSDSSTDQISVYVVREGDTLSSIAKMFGVTENTIRWANDLSVKTSIKKDQQLIILPISGVKYVVKKGDSLKSIASAFNADQDEILSFNNFASASELKAGVEIIVPNGEVTNTVSKPSSNTTKGSTVKGGLASGVKTTTAGWLMRPISGGRRTQGIHGHNGVDLASSLNTPIMAAAGGKVIIAKQGGWNGGYGSYVVISHPNGMQTLYAHMNSVAATVGQTVSQGTVIGYMGSTGDSSGIHLHFEVRGGVNPF